jgi:hypothetical protein
LLTLDAMRMPFGTVFALGVATVLATSCDDDFTEDVFLCEEALAHVRECCPKTDLSGVECAYEHSTETGRASCTADWNITTSRNVEPAIAPDDAHCVLGTSCEELVARGACERAAVSRPDMETSVHEDAHETGCGWVPASDTNTRTARNPPVCR